MGTQIQISRTGAFQASAGKQTLRELISALAKVKKEDVCVKPSREWVRVLGLTLTVVISAGCWALIIALLLR
jgi:hypothetical protein